jgi:tetratricopeptide (TPR) repeat protein/predicted Ser/Thr protein kinase
VSGASPSNDEVTAVVLAHGSSETSDADAPSIRPLVDNGIGRYLVIDEIGRGAMGFVLRAYDPKLQREVALKRVRSVLLGDEARVRLVREARAMARLNHPNVVAVYDVELTENAGVVMVMEYVAGTTLRQWLERDPVPSVRQIIESFTAAGRGLAAAHAEGLLHRDFKLENVLVGSDGRVRVTDFGLARVTAGRGPDESTNRRHAEDDGDAELTAAGTVMGTPAYMAPEQHEGRDLDARADQYGFCVALWRALAKTWPFEGRGNALPEAKRAGPPRWPTEIAVPRHIVAALRRGLAFEPADRWPNMAALLAELGRDPTRRRRGALAAGGLALVIAGAWGWQRIAHTRALAACASEGEDIAVTWNAARADAIASAFAATGIGYATDAWQRARGRFEDHAEQWQRARTQVCEAEVERTITAERAQASRSCLDEHRDRLGALLDHLERPDAGVVQRAGTASAWLPQLDECTNEMRLRARPELPADPQVQAQIGALRNRLEHASAARVIGRYDEALAAAQAVRIEASSSFAPLVAEAKLVEGRSLDSLGRPKESRTILEEAFFEAMAASRDDLALEIGILLVFTLGERLALHDEALHWGRLSQTLAQRMGRSDDLAIAGLFDGLGNVHSAKGAYDDALALHEKALAIQERVLGEVHPHVAVSLNSLGTVRHKKGEHAVAVELYARALAIREEVFGPDHPHVAGSLNNLANAYRDTGQVERALQLQLRGLGIMEKTLGAEHPRIAALLNNLGELHRVQQQYDEARGYYERALAMMEKSLGATHRDLAVPLFNLGLVHAAKGEGELALALHRRALAIREQALGPEHPDVAASLQAIAELQTALANAKRTPD